MLLFTLVIYFAIKYYVLYKSTESIKFNCEVKDVVLSAVNGGYYFYNSLNEESFFSINLISQFNIQRESNDFSDISSIFPHHRKALDDYVNDIKSNDIDKFEYKITRKINGKIFHYKCVGNKIESSSGDIIGIIVWFFDVSEYISRIRNSVLNNKNLRDKYENLNDILDNLSIAIWQNNENLDIEFYNKTYLKLIVDDNYQVSSEKIPEIDGDLKVRLESIALCNNLQTTNKHLVFQGQRRLYEINQKKLYNNKYISYAIDVTKQEELQNSLASHISAHSDLLESTSSAIAIFRSDTKLEFYNNTFRRLWDLEESWLNSKPNYSELLIALRDKRKLPEQSNFKDFRNEHLDMFHNLIEPHNEFMYLPDGKSIRTIVIPHAMGGLLFVYEDLTDHLAMKSSYDTLIAVQKKTLRNLSEGVLVIEEDGKVRLFNPALLKLWTELAEFVKKLPHISEILEKSKKLLTYKGNWEQYKKQIMSDLASRVHNSRIFTTKNQKFIRCSIVPLPDGATLLSFVDISDSKLIETTLRERAEALKKVDSLKTQFLTNVSYELRAPLTTIMGFTEALHAEIFGKLNDKQSEYVNNIYDASRNLKVLINDVIDLASIEAGYMKLNIRSFDIISALNDITNIVISNNKEITLDTEFDENINSMIGDEKRIKHIAFNLIDKGIKLMQNDGKGLFSLVKTGDNQLCISFEIITQSYDIEDNDKNFIINNILSDKFSKNFGLSVVKNIVELHEGRFEISNDNTLNPKISCYFQINSENLIKKEHREREEIKIVSEKNEDHI